MHLPLETTLVLKFYVVIVAFISIYWKFYLTYQFILCVCVFVLQHSYAYPVSDSFRDFFNILPNRHGWVHHIKYVFLYFYLSVFKTHSGLKKNSLIEDNDSQNLSE